MDRFKRTYSREDIERFTSATKCELMHWTKKKLFRPLRGKRGTGHHNRYTFITLVEAESAAQLNSFGLSVEKIRRFIKALRDARYVGPVSFSFLNATLSLDVEGIIRTCEEQTGDSHQAAEQATHTSPSLLSATPQGPSSDSAAPESHEPATDVGASLNATRVDPSGADSDRLTPSQRLAISKAKWHA